MTNNELIALATEVRDQVWKGREADDIPLGEVRLAAATRELWQEITHRFLDISEL